MDYVWLILIPPRFDLLPLPHTPSITYYWYEKKQNKDQCNVTTFYKSQPHIDHASS